MDATKTSGPTDLEWAPVEACTLPTAEVPLRLADFDALFATALQSVEPDVDGTRARLLLAVRSHWRSGSNGWPMPSPRAARSSS